MLRKKKNRQKERAIPTMKITDHKLVKDTQKVEFVPFLTRFCHPFDQRSSGSAAILKESIPRIFSSFKSNFLLPYLKLRTSDLMQT